MEINNIADLGMLEEAPQEPTKPKDSIKTKEQKEKNKKKKEEATLDSGFVVEHDPEKFKLSEESLNLSEWAKEPNVRDSKGRAPGQEGYDPTTLYIPSKALDKMGTLMKKYWEVKSNHYDKLVFIRLHKVYFVYHQDAYICHTEIGSRLYSRFGCSVAYLHSPKINMYCQKLAEKNYKVVLVEPTQVYENKDNANLDIYQIITKGTFVESNPNNFTSRYCLFLMQKENEWGYTYVDTTTHEFFMGEFEDTPNRTRLRSLLLKVMPAEIVCRDIGISKDTVLMMKNLYWKPIVTLIALIRPRGIETIINELKKYLPEQMAEEQEELKGKRSLDEKRTVSNPGLEVIQTLVTMAEDFVDKIKERRKEIREDTRCPNYSVLQGLYLALEYLEYICLSETVFRNRRFFFHDLKKETQKNLILDGQTVINLELTDISYLNSQPETMSLLKYMDRTSCPFGKRMFQKWLLNPLRDINRINERLDAVEDLILNNTLCEDMQKRLSKLSDLERKVHNIYNFGSRYIFHMLDFQAYVKPKLNLFAEALTQLREADNIIKSFSGRLNKLKSARLCQLLTYTNNHTTLNSNTTIKGLFPQIDNILAELESKIVIKDKSPVPAPGMDHDYDKLHEEVENIQEKLREYLTSVRKRFRCEEIKYVHIKHRYEIEIPEHLVEGRKKPQEFQITSKKKGYLRFHTPEVQELTYNIWELEQEIHKVTLPFLVKCFKTFHMHSTEWQQVVLCLSELDCLASLAQVTMNMGLYC